MVRQFDLENGALLVREEGDRVCCEAHREGDRQSLYRAWVCRGEHRFLLGALAPDKQGHFLRRRFRRTALERAGAWPPDSAYFEQVCGPALGTEALPPGWKREERPGRYLGEDLLIQAAKDLREALLREHANGFSLAVPFSVQQPFPLLPLMCFPETRRLGGQLMLVFAFDRGGMPVMGNKGTGAREQYDCSGPTGQHCQPGGSMV